MINFQREKISMELFDEMLPLLHAHWKEVAHFQDIELEPDFSQYIKIEELGMLRVFTARKEDNSLIGYSFFFVRSNPHYKSSVQAVQDVIFIDKKERGFGKKFINWCDSMLKEEGVQAVYHHTKNEHNFGPMLETLGYELVDLIYARRLDKWEQ